MANHYRLLCLIIVPIYLVGCATAVPRNARLYCIETGAILTAQIKDARQTHGQINMKDPATGELFTGEYTSIPNDTARVALANTHWATGYGFSFNRPTMIYGEGILMGNAGTVIEIVYAIDRKNLHGYGMGRDNSGNRYKVHF